MMNLFENLQNMKEENIINDPAWDNTFGEVPVFEAEYVFNGKRLEVTLTEEEEFINVHINDSMYLQEPKEIVNNDHDLEYLAFTSATDYYKELKFADKIEEAAILKNEKDVEQIVESAQLRTFTGQDSWTWGGATNFADGEPPMIAESDFATLIVSGPDSGDNDGATVSIYYGDPEADKPFWGFKCYDNKELALKDARILIKLLDDEIDESQLDRFGFEIM